MILRAEEAAILPYCNDDKRESAEKMRLRRVRFIFVNLTVVYKFFFAKDEKSWQSPVDRRKKCSIMVHTADKKRNAPLRFPLKRSLRFAPVRLIGEYGK